MLGELRTQIAACDGFIGTRLHSVFLAVYANVPMLAISQGSKAWNFMSENAWVGSSFIYKRGPGSSLEIKAVKKTLAGICEAETKKARFHFDLVFQIIERKKSGKLG